MSLHIQALHKESKYQRLTASIGRKYHIRFTEHGTKAVITGPTGKERTIKLAASK